MEGTEEEKTVDEGTPINKQAETTDEETGTTDEEPGTTPEEVGTTREEPPHEEAVPAIEEGMITNEHGELVPDYDQTIKIFDEGDIVEGVVVQVDRDEILVDIGYKSEGVIPIRELSIRSDKKAEEIVKVGEDIEALVLQKEDKDGRLILSKKRAEYERSWDRIEEMYKSETVVEGEVIEVVKGGLIVDVGLRGFLPASLVDLRRVKELGKYVGEKIEAAIVEMDRNRNNVVLSRRAVLEKERRSEREKILGSLEKGQIITGKVSSVVDFGAFVDLGGIDGLIHISELSWTHVAHPSEVVSVGDEVNVQVLDVEPERQRVSLGLKQTQEDPWRERVKNINVGDILDGKITKLVPFGAFVAIAPGVEGLIHISELSTEHVELPEQVVKAGEEVKPRVVDIDLDRRRISLSLKETQPAEVPEELAEGDLPESEAAPGPEEARVEAEVALESGVEEPGQAVEEGLHIEPKPELESETDVDYEELGEADVDRMEPVRGPEEPAAEAATSKAKLEEEVDVPPEIGVAPETTQVTEEAPAEEAEVAEEKAEVAEEAPVEKAEEAPVEEAPAEKAEKAKKPAKKATKARAKTEAEPEAAEAEAAEAEAAEAEPEAVEVAEEEPKTKPKARKKAKEAKEAEPPAEEPAAEEPAAEEPAAEEPAAEEPLAEPEAVSEPESAEPEPEAPEPEPESDEPEPEPGSLEDILRQMKQQRGTKT